MEHLSTVVFTAGFLIATSLSGQTVPAPALCKDAPTVPAGALAPNAPSPDQVQANSGPQFVAAPSNPSGSNPCGGFADAHSPTTDTDTIKGGIQDLTKNALQNGVLSAADLPAEMPTDPLADMISTASKGTAFLVKDGGVKEVLAKALPELLASPWVTAGLGVNLQSSSTESQQQNNTDPPQLVYHRALDVTRQMQALSSAGDAGLPIDTSQFRESCVRLSGALAVDINALTPEQLSEANQVMSVCQQAFAPGGPASSTPQFANPQPKGAAPSTFLKPSSPNSSKNTPSPLSSCPNLPGALSCP